MMVKNYALLFALTVLAGSCGRLASAPEREISQGVEDFAEAYFNYDLVRAATFCTPESRKWIEFLASNIYEADMAVLQSRDGKARVSVEEIKYNEGDTTGTAVIEVRDCLQADTIGRPVRMVEKATFTLGFVYKDNRCRVRMEGLPRSGMQGRG